MPYMLVRHKVEDYNKWKPVFDEHGSVRKQTGSKGGLLLRHADNPNETFVLIEFDTLENAHKFHNDPSLPEAMQRAGVADRPDIYFLEEVERFAQ